MVLKKPNLILQILIYLLYRFFYKIFDTNIQNKDKMFYIKIQKIYRYKCFYRRNT